jgi:hypothetical protein
MKTRINRYAHEVIIHGPSRVVYRPDCPLACGAAQPELLPIALE